MSGVTGNQTIKGRDTFKEIFNEYKNDLLTIPGIDNVQISGSFNSNINKHEFGDMDLIITIKGDKKEIKKDLSKILLNHSGLRPFVSDKYKGKMFYNSGEIISVSYKKGTFEACQIDNIIATSKTEADFKLNFLNLPAEKQGLLLGLMKVVFDEGWQKNPNLEPNQDLEYNLSSKELQKRLVTFHPGTRKELKREILETSRDWDKVQTLVPFDLDKSFEELLVDVKTLKRNSKDRVKGLFKSMVSVKSGEVNKPKGLHKMYCLGKVDQL